MTFFRLFLLVFIAWGFLGHAPVSKELSQHLYKGLPGIQGTLLERGGYFLAHNSETKTAHWISYKLTDEDIKGDAVRKNNFKPDPDLREGDRAELADYAASGYDRGHLVPAADRKSSQTLMDETFLLSNMAPQLGVGFNRGIWKSLEAKVRKWAKEHGELYVFVGPVYEEFYEVIGETQVGVPQAFFKIIVIPSSVPGNIRASAYLLPHEPNPSDLLPTFITSIDAIEETTGLDFLHELENEIEDVLEAAKETL